MAVSQTVAHITVERPDEQQLQQLRVNRWPVWTKEPSTFDWHYGESETCYFLEGEVIVKTRESLVRIGRGDLVTFPMGLDCTWHVKQAVRKHYRFGP